MSMVAVCPILHQLGRALAQPLVHRGDSVIPGSNILLTVYIVFKQSFH